MVYVIDGSVSVGVALSEKGSESSELPIHANNLVELSIIQNAHLLLPTFSLTFYDEAHIDEQSGLFSDGTTLQVFISDAKYGTPRWSKFNIHGKPQALRDPQGTKMSLTGILDMPEYFRKRVRRAYKGTSADVITEVAKEAQISVDVVDTNDSMTWLPNGKSLGEFCRSTAERGWKSDQSCLDLAICEKKQGSGDQPWMLRYVDIVKEFKSTPSSGTIVNASVSGKIPGGADSNKIIVATDYTMKTNSGLNNMMFGYGRRTSIPRLDGTFQQFEQVIATRSSQFLDMNKNIKEGLLGSVVREFVPLDIGNTYENYQRAKHQNRMVKSTYSTSLQVLTTAFTGLTIFDLVDVRFVTSSGEIDLVRSGKYMVRAKTQTAAGEHYREKLELVSQGPEVNAGGSLL